MDDEFKTTLNQAGQDDHDTEEVIIFEGKLFRNALTLLCIGLVLTGFNLNIEGLELASYSTWTGAVLLTLGLWMLREENRRISAAFRCGVLILLIRTAGYWIGAFPSHDAVSALGFTILAASLIVLIVQMYYMFSGLRDIALRFENGILANRFMRCFWLYVSLLVLLLVCMVIPYLFYLLIPYALFVLIYLPVSVNKLRPYAPLSEDAISLRRINRWAVTILCLYIIATIGGELGCLYYANAPRPETRLYDSFSSPDAAAVREHLKEFGMPAYVLNDLPDDEVVLYTGIYDSISQKIENNEISSRDGGELEIYNFVGMMPKGKVRTLYYYRWLELPRHAYIDSLSISNTFDEFLKGKNTDGKGLSLYDKDGKTYSQTLLHNGTKIGFIDAEPFPFMQNFSDSGSVTQMQFRLYPHYENQRGYVALNSIIEEPDQAMVFSNWLTYVHQKSLWNRPYFDTLNHVSANGYSRINNTAFCSEGFVSVTDYRPEGWQPPEVE